VLNLASSNKDLWGSGGTAPYNLNLGTGWEWSAPSLGHFTHREKIPNNHWTGFFFNFSHGVSLSPLGTGATV
jgi:hypothetical protein